MCGSKRGVDRPGGLRADLGIHLEAVPCLEVGNRGLGVGAVIAAPAQTVAQLGERTLNRLHLAAPIAKTQNLIANDRDDALRDVLFRG